MALDLRPPEHKLRLVLGALCILAVGFLVGRFALSLHEDSFQAKHPIQIKRVDSQSTGLAPHLSTEAMPLSKENSAPPEWRPSERNERIRQIEIELNNLQPGDSELLKSLASEIQVAQARINELRFLLGAAERNLLEQSKRSSSNDHALRWLQYQQEIFMLGRELADAKSAVADQERLLQVFWGSDEETAIMHEMRRELAKRQANLRSTEEKIKTYNNSQESSLIALNERENAELLAWRAQRAELEATYAEAVEALNYAKLSYQEVAQQSAERKMKEKLLRKEKATLEAAGEL